MKDIIFILRLTITIILMTTVWFSLIRFFFSKNPVKKLLTLALIYNMVVVLLFYIIVLYKVEDDLFPVIMMVFINFIFTFMTGIGIINNILKKEGL